MHTFYEDYIERLEDLIADMKKALDGLPQEALDWSPGEDMSSIATLAAHTAGSTRTMVGAVVGGDPIERDRNAEFTIEGVDAAALIASLDEMVEHTRGVVAKLSLKDMDDMAPSPFSGNEFRKSWWLLHALEHVGSHVGHIQITRQMWDMRK